MNLPKSLNSPILEEFNDNWTFFFVTEEVYYCPAPDATKGRHKNLLDMPNQQVHRAVLSKILHSACFFTTGVKWRFLSLP